MKHSIHNNSNNWLRLIAITSVGGFINPKQQDREYTPDRLGDIM